MIETKSSEVILSKSGNPFVMTPFSADGPTIQYQEENAKHPYVVRAWIDEDGMSWAELTLSSHSVMVSTSGSIYEALVRLEVVMLSHYPHLNWYCPNEIDLYCRN